MLARWVPLYHCLQETCVSLITDIIDGIRARAVEPRFYLREVALVRGEGDVRGDDHRELGRDNCRRAGARDTKMQFAKQWPKLSTKGGHL